MKAVIMAGGEGTRLRPLTSNAPKPMLPLVNQPMMEHIVGLLKRHGFDEIVVTVAFLANHIRTYFGDGSEFGVRMVYATEETPLGTAGSVRNAMDELDERFLVISGDVLTDIDLGRASCEAHDEKQGAGHHRARPRSRTRSSSASSSPARTARSSASSRSRRGARCSATPSTPASSCSSRRSSTTSPPDRPVDFSGEVFPALLADGQAALRRGRRGLLGGRRHARGLPAGPQGHPRRQGRGRRSPASR